MLASACAGSATANSHLDLSNRELAVDHASTSVEKRIGNRRSAPRFGEIADWQSVTPPLLVEKRIGNRQRVPHFGEKQAGSRVDDRFGDSDARQRRWTLVGGHRRLRSPASVGRIGKADCGTSVATSVRTDLPNLLGNRLRTRRVTVTSVATSRHPPQSHLGESTR